MRPISRWCRWWCFGLIALSACGVVSLGRPGGAVDLSSGVNVDAGPGAGTPVSITVSPSSQTVTVANGNIADAGASTSFSASVLYDNGSNGAVNCTWTVDNVQLGAMTDSTFHASGTAGGVGNVLCTAAGLTGKAIINVNLADTTDLSNLDAASKASLTAATSADPDVTKLLYPYDGTVFPRGLAAPELMWSGGSAADLYSVHIHETGMDYTFFFAGSNPQRQTIPADEWLKLVSSSAGGPATVTLTRLKGGAGGSAYVSAVQHWTLSTADLRGTIYYWGIQNESTSNMLRLKPGAAPESFLNTGGRCAGCHAVGGGSIIVGLDPSAFISGFNMQTNNKSWELGRQSGYRTVSNDGLLTVWVPASGSNGYLGDPLELADATTGATLEPSGLSAFGLATTPAFSWDESKLAMGLRPSDAGQQHNVFRYADLAIADFNVSTKQFSNLHTLKMGAGKVAAFPTFTPDNKALVYEMSNFSRSRALAESSTPWSGAIPKSDLYLIRTDGTADVALAALNSGGIDPIDAGENFQPTFNPVVQGGYFWVAFFSMRQYGNRLTNTVDADYSTCVHNLPSCRSRQLWVSAIDVNAPAGSDPSHPAFWLPGQDLGTENMGAFWALDQCKQMGDSCDAGFECCQGVCRGQGDEISGSGKTCQMPSAGECAQEGDKCAASSDCCNGETCIGSVCTLSIN